MSDSVEEPDVEYAKNRILVMGEKERQSSYPNLTNDELLQSLRDEYWDLADADLAETEVAEVELHKMRENGQATH